MSRAAAILAAGLGSRLGEASGGGPKGLLGVGGVPLVLRSVRCLREAGWERIVLGTGHAAERYDALFAGDPGVRRVRNPRYADSGSLYTLWCLRRELAGASEVLLLESDLLYEPRALEALAADGRPDLVLASDGPLSDAVYLETDAAGRLVALSKRREDLSSSAGVLVGITRLSPTVLALMLEFMERRIPAGDLRVEYEQALAAAAQERPVGVLVVPGLAWCEIDDREHLRFALEEVWPRILDRSARRAEQTGA